MVARPLDRAPAAEPCGADRYGYPSRRSPIGAAPMIMPTQLDNLSATMQLAPGRLTFESVSKRFDRSEVSALEEVSLVCEPGEFVVVVGPSGCGKTTLLNLAAGMLKADA